MVKINDDTVVLFKAKQGMLAPFTGKKKLKKLQHCSVSVTCKCETKTL